MALLGSILKRTIRIRKNLPVIRRGDAYKKQVQALRKLIASAEHTAFGEQYGFPKLLNEKDIVSAFQERVPVHDYNSIFKAWWYRCLNGETFVCWPGRVRHFALSSGTSEASSKHIPVTREMISAIRKASVRQILSLAHYDLPEDLFQKGILLLGGSTHLQYNGSYFEGDLSGITASKIPFWFQHFYKPGRRIARERDWSAKLEEIVRKAKEWDIGIIGGVPAWIQILLEKIIAHYQVSTIHDIWPNLQIYVHGGVSFGPYKKGFEKLLARPLIYLETYLASEGFIAYQERPDAEGMKLLLNNGIFFEFVPFNGKNFSADGRIAKKPQVLTLKEADEHTEYAILLTTCSGAWRYLIGDTVRFTSLERQELVITGRVKHFLSLCGEHLSVDNMSRAIEMVAEELNIEIKEFSVAGINYQNLFAHKWYIGTDDAADPHVLKDKIDEALKALNDDYRVERMAALKDVFLEVLPSRMFYDWMRLQGKEGAQNKFPRVLKNKHLADWEQWLRESKLQNA